MPPKENPKMKKKSTYKKDYKAPKFDKMKIQTTHKEGLSYADKYQNKSLVTKTDTTYTKSYNTH